MAGRCSENTPGLGRTEVQSSSKLLGFVLLSMGRKMRRLNRQTCEDPGNLYVPALTERSGGELKFGLEYCETATSLVTNHTP